jgi:hypothetical protein
MGRLLFGIIFTLLLTESVDRAWLVRDMRSLKPRPSNALQALLAPPAVPTVPPPPPPVSADGFAGFPRMSIMDSGGSPEAVQAGCAVCHMDGVPQGAAPHEMQKR